MSSSPAESGLNIPDQRLRASQAAPDTGESRSDIAFCIALWLLGERFGAEIDPDAAALVPAAPDASSLKTAGIRKRLDTAMGPCFTDKGRPINLNMCYDTSLSAEDEKSASHRPANHPWNAYQRGPLDTYFSKLCANLEPATTERLIEALGGRIPANAGFGGAEGFPFHGIKDSVIVEKAGSKAKMLESYLMSGVGPNDELVLRFRRVGEMGFQTDSSFSKTWCFKLYGERDSGGKTRQYPSEKLLYDNKMKESYLDADLDGSRTGADGQQVRRTQPERVMDYLVCAPFTAAWELEQEAKTPEARATAARKLKTLFLYAYQDGAHHAFAPEARTALAGLSWPESPLETAAVIAAALVRFVFGAPTLADALRSLFLADLSCEAEYLEHLCDWALEITERDGASVKAANLQDVYVAPPFTGENPVAWLMEKGETGNLLLQAGSGMGKTFLLRALTAACAGARLQKMSDLTDRAAKENDAARFAAALAASAHPEGTPDDPADRALLLADHLPVFLQQTRDESLYQRLAGLDGDALTFEEFSFEAMPPLMKDAVRSAVAESPAQNASQTTGLNNVPSAPDNPLAILLRREGVLLMVDSIDEIPRRFRALYLQRLKSFVAEAGIERLIVTSRPLPPADTAALLGVTGPGATIAQLAPFDEDRQRALFQKVATRGGADEYHGPAYEQVHATAGFPEVMGNPFMLDAIARELRGRGRAADCGASWLFSKINDKFRKRATLDPNDRAALEHLAFDLTVGRPALPTAEFIERFRRYRNDEASRNVGAAVTLDLDEDEVMDLIMSRLGIIDIRADEVGFPYAAMKGFWAALWVRRCVERAQGEPKSSLDLEGCSKAQQQELFERGCRMGSQLVGQLLAAHRIQGKQAEAEDAGLSASAAIPASAPLLALMFVLDYAGSRAHVDHPSFDLLCTEVYRSLLSSCLFGSAEEEAAAIAALQAASTFGFGHALPSYEKETAPYRNRLAAFGQKA